MKSFRFLHAADLHLDSPFKGLFGLPDAVRDRIRESTFSALSRMVDIAIDEQVDFVIIAGDVYDLADRSLRAQLRFQQAVGILSDNGIPVYAVHGNHDPLDGARARLLWPESVHFFAADSVETVIARNKDGEEIAAVSGISYGKAATMDNLAERFAQPVPSLFNIAILHTNVDGDADHDNYAPCTKDQLIRSGYDYWALGHIHTRRMLHDSPPIVYPGNIQGRNVRETGAKGCYIVDVDSTGQTTMSFHATEAVRWEQLKLSIQGWTEEQQLKNGLDKLMSDVQANCGDIPAVIRVTLTGRSVLHTLLQEGSHLQELLAELRDEQALAAEVNGGRGSFVWIESCRVETGAEIPFDKLLEQESFIGDLLRLSEAMLADDSALSAFSETALEPLLNHTKASKLLKDVGPDQLRLLLSAARELAADELLGESIDVRTL